MSIYNKSTYINTLSLIYYISIVAPSDYRAEIVNLCGAAAFTFGIKTVSGRSSDTPGNYIHVVACISCANGNLWDTNEKDVQVRCV